MFDWKTPLSAIFGGAINQEPLEDAADLMVSVSARDPGYHSENLAALQAGIQACDNGSTDVISVIHKSGYRVSSLEEAKELLVEFLGIYEEKYRQAIESNSPLH